jgi:hypothetical protein
MLAQSSGQSQKAVTEVLDALQSLEKDCSKRNNMRQKSHRPTRACSDARNKKLSPKRRKEIAVNAANARWLKHKKKAPVGVSPARR